MNATVDPLLADVITDAKIVAAYGHRAGLLPDEALMIAISAVEAKSPPTWSDPEVGRLQRSLTQAIRHIYPTTLADLRGTWKPFTKNAGNSLKTLVIFALTFGLMFVAAISTITYNKGLHIATELERLNGQKPGPTVRRIVRDVIESRTRAADPANVASLGMIRGAFFELMEEWREIDRGIEVYFPAGTDFNERYSNPFALLMPRSASSPKDVGTDTFMAVYCAKVTGGTGEANTIKVLDENMFGKDGLMVLRLSCSNNIKFHPEQVPPLEQVLRQLKETLDTYTLWWLPGVYGALGATIYYMRMVLNPVLPDPSYARIAHRVALGGFAGIIVGWFWTPTSTADTEIASIGLSLLGVSFLVGFSIDAFFSLLDRIVSLIAGAVGKMGSQDGRPAAT